MQVFKTTLIFLTGLLLLVVASCTKETPLAPDAVIDSAVAASIKLSEQNYAAAAIDSLILTITGERFALHQKLNLDGTRAQMQLTVPPKMNLNMKVTAYQDTTAVLEGSQNFTAKAGKVTNVQIKLDFLVPTIILSPPDTTITVNDTIDVYLSARNVTELSTFGAEVHFDPTLLKVVELGREDEFLKKNNGSVMQAAFTQDNTNGVVKAVLGVFPASAAVTGSGTVGRIRFQALASDTTDIWIKVDNKQDSDLGLFDNKADLMYSVGLGSRLVIQQQAN